MIGMESMATRTRLRYAWAYLTPGKCSLAKPTAMKKCNFLCKSTQSYYDIISNMNPWSMAMPSKDGVTQSCVSTLLKKNEWHSRCDHFAEFNTNTVTYNHIPSYIISYWHIAFRCFVSLNTSFRHTMHRFVYAIPFPCEASNQCVQVR